MTDRKKILADEWKGRSKLDPHHALIVELRQKRRSYVRIATILKQQFNITVVPSSIYDFLRVRSRHPAVRYELPTTAPAPAFTFPAVLDVRARVEAFQVRKQSEAPATPRFEYTEGEPLILMPETDKERK
jgi:hypothetical protein